MKKCDGKSAHHIMRGFVHPLNTFCFTDYNKVVDFNNLKESFLSIKIILVLECFTQQVMWWRKKTHFHHILLNQMPLFIPEPKILFSQWHTHVYSPTSPLRLLTELFNVPQLFCLVRPKQTDTAGLSVYWGFQDLLWFRTLSPCCQQGALVLKFEFTEVETNPCLDQ